MIFRSLIIASLIPLVTSTAADLLLERVVVNKPGSFLESSPGIELPEGMVVQGSEVHYRVSIPDGSSLSKDNTRFKFGFKQKRGDVKFIDAQGGDKNHFVADWYGENIVTVFAKDMKSGLIKSVDDTVICHFASRRVLGGNAEKLSDAYKKNIRRREIHDIKGEEKGMAYLPKDISRGDRSSEQIKKGFFETTEPRIFKTSKGTLLTSVQARRIGKNDAPTGQGIVIQRSVDQGSSWSGGMLLDQDGNDVWGYTALVEVDGKVFCYVVAGHPGHQDANKKIRGIYFYTSTDDGKTWSTRKRHDELSAAMGIELGQKIPNGASPNCNILVVPGMTIDEKPAAKGKGLLFSTYAHGWLWGSINGGKNWSMVGYCKDLADPKKNGYGKPVQIENELGWSVLDNDAGDIYMVWRRQSFTGYKNEYVVSKHFKTGPMGIQVKQIYNQDLKNIPARRCHFGQRTIESGVDKGKVLVASQGAGSRNHIQLYRTKDAIQGSKSISAGMYEMATVMKDIAWGYCDLEFLSAKNPAYPGLGQDAIMLFGESEPVHKLTHQIIQLAPNGKGRDERYTATSFLFSVEYFNFLLKGSQKNLEEKDVSFEANQGWEGFVAQQGPHQVDGNRTDKAGIIWGDSSESLFIYRRDDVARSGEQCIVLGHATSKTQTLYFKLPSGTKQVSFYINRFSGNSGKLELTVEQQSGSSWKEVFSESYQGGTIPSNYKKVSAELSGGDGKVRISVTGAKGFLLDDFELK